MFTFGRQELDLNGTWKFCPDPMQRCRAQQWWVNAPQLNTNFPSWDPDGMWEIQVPGTWKTQFEKLEWYDGHAVYMKEFTIPEIPEDYEAFLVFDGIIYSSDIYLNGQLVGKHDWGYSAFTARVTDCLFKHNRLFVLVQNLHNPETVPSVRYDWNNDGGIVNPVKLIFVPRTHIENFRTETRLQDVHALISVEITLASRIDRAWEDVTVRIPELGLESTVVVDRGAPARVEFSVPLDDIQLWSPENPKLYRTELSTRFETISDEIGYREIKREGNQILLNGKPIRLYGLSIHSEFKETGRTATPEGIAMLIDRVKDLGVNFLRCAHYPYAESFGRALDRAGILWWEEVPAYWMGNMGDPTPTRLAVGMLEDTIRRDWNRASVIIWSVSNECCWMNPNKPEENNYSYYFTAVEKIRELDNTRLVSAAEAGNMLPVDPPMIWTADKVAVPSDEARKWRPGHLDAIYDLFDVFAANLYVGTGQAKERYARYLQLLKPYNKPIMLSEFGSMSLRDSGLPADQFGSEENHAEVIRDAYDSFIDLPDLIGYSPWCLNDIRVPIHWRWFSQGKGVFRYGVLDENWEEKEAYGVLKESIAKVKEHFGDA